MTLPTRPTCNCDLELLGRHCDDCPIGHGRTVDYRDIPIRPTEGQNMREAGNYHVRFKTGISQEHVGPRIVAELCDNGRWNVPGSSHNYETVDFAEIGPRIPPPVTLAPSQSATEREKWHKEGMEEARQIVRHYPFPYNASIEHGRVVLERAIVEASEKASIVSQPDLPEGGKERQR